MLRKNSFLFAIIFLSVHFISAQDYSHGFGVLTDYEKKMTTYEKDTTAEAVVIFDSGESTFYRDGEGFKLKFKRHCKIKILKESYINDANFSIPIYQGPPGKAILSL